MYWLALWNNHPILLAYYFLPNKETLEIIEASARVASMKGSTSSDGSTSKDVEIVVRPVIRRG
jgi:hypothetical protein